ncbi:MAG: ATP-dependent zinc metalloprotease FtsH [Pseudomonadota bacterium]
MKYGPKWLTYVLLGTIGLVALILFFQPVTTPTAVPTVAYTEFKRMVETGEVSSITLRGDEIGARLNAPTQIGVSGGTSSEIKTTVPDFGDLGLLPLLEAHKVAITVRPDSSDLAGNWLAGLLPWVILIGFYFWFWNRMQRNVTGRFGGRDMGEFLEGSARREEKGAPKVTFDDVAGQDGAKREVAELVAFLKDPERYRKLGAEPPRGVLLMGPPGTGKTLLARALAGEAGVQFFHISASEFIEMFVGVGAARVRKMFEEAKNRAPAIIFIDELDAVGRVRGTGLGGGNDEREQTLNQILSELDGFSGREAVVVLAATNRPDVLDPALLRPGRFDRHVTLELPDKTARAAILKVHTKNVPLADDADLDLLAAGTPGFSGADLKNLINEAALAAARDGVGEITARHLDDMRDKVMMGTVRTLAIKPDERHRLAVHEAGHTVVAKSLPEADPVYKVTIIPRGRALGGTHMLPEEDRHTLPEGYLRDRLAVMLGGRGAEQELLGAVSSGAEDDIRQATQLARAMVARWGMSETIGPVDLRQSDQHPFLGREIAQPRQFGEATADEVDQAVQRLLRESEARATRIIRDRRAEIERLVEELESKETLTSDEIDAIIEKKPGDGTVPQETLKLRAG